MDGKMGREMDRQTDGQNKQWMNDGWNKRWMEQMDEKEECQINLQDVRKKEKRTFGWMDGWMDPHTHKNMYTLMLSAYTERCSIAYSMMMFYCP